MDQDQDHSFSLTENIQMNTDDGVDPEQEQQDDSVPDTKPESNQGTSEPRDQLPPLAYIESRMKQLHNRRFLLLQMQHFKKKSADTGVRTTEEILSVTSEYSDQLCELKAIQEELKELLVKKELLQKPGNRSKVTDYKGQQDTHPCFFKSKTPRGGIYTLPPPQLEQEGETLEVKAGPVSERPTGPVVPVESLAQTPAAIKCPSCEETVFTETSSRVGETTWLLFYMCTMMGCVAGCCLIPFFMSRVKDVHHQCPKCQAKIHIHQPL